MTKTVADVLKSRKFAKINGYCSYEFVVDSVKKIFAGALNVPFELVLQESIRMMCDDMTSKSCNANTFDPFLLEAINPEYHYPVFCVSKELCCAFYHTVPLVNRRKNGIARISLSNVFIDKGIVLMPKEIDGQKTVISAYIFKVFPSQGIYVTMLSWHRASCGLETIFFQDVRDDQLPEDQPLGPIAPVDFEPTDFLLNLFFYQAFNKINSTQDYSEPLYAKSKGFGAGNHKGILSPRMIGEGYKPRVIRNKESAGTHASPRTHWRCGHWRRHMVGCRENPQHKTIWVEPVLVNG